MALKTLFYVALGIKKKILNDKLLQLGFAICDVKWRNARRRILRELCAFQNFF